MGSPGSGDGSGNSRWQEIMHIHERKSHEQNPFFCQEFDRLPRQLFVVCNMAE